MKDNKRLKRRVRNSYIVSTVSMALVLFLLGSVGYLMTAALRVARTLQESVTVTVELADGVDSLRRGEIERRLRGDEMVRDIEFVSKQTKIGDAEFRHMFENEIEEVLGENPLNDSFEVHLSAESADSVRLDAFMAKAGGMRGVERATCPLPMIRRMHATVNKIQLVLAVFAAALLAISLILLSNTIRLSIYSKRYLINTMKLVGATKWFIMRPFLASSVWQGLAAGAGAVRRSALRVERGPARTDDARGDDQGDDHRGEYDGRRRGARAAFYGRIGQPVRRHEIGQDTLVLRGRTFEQKWVRYPVSYGRSHGPRPCFRILPSPEFPPRRGLRGVCSAGLPLRLRSAGGNKDRFVGLPPV